MEGKIYILKNLQEIQDAERMNLKLPKPDYGSVVLNFLVEDVMRYYVDTDEQGNQFIVVTFVDNCTFRFYYENNLELIIKNHLNFR